MKIINVKNDYAQANTLEFHKPKGDSQFLLSYFFFVSSPDSVVYICICKENTKIKKIIKNKN